MAKRAAILSPYWAERLYPSALVQANPLDVAVQVPNELVPTGYSPDEIRRWIKAVCRRLSLTPTELARKANLAPSTLNRFMSGSSVNENISAATIQKLTHAAGLIFNKIISQDLDDVANAIEVESNWSGKPRSSFDKTSVIVPVVGYVGTNIWNTRGELSDEEIFDVTMPIYDAYTNLPIIGLEVRGGTSNKKYPNTTILICVPFYALDRRPVDGEFVIVNRKNSHGDVEVVVRQYMEERFAADGPAHGQWLIGLEGDRPFQGPIDVQNYAGDILNDSLLISFLIVASIQPEPRLFQRPKDLDPRKR